MVFTAPTGHTYTTQPHGGDLFPALRQSTGELNTLSAIDSPDTARGVMMPRRKQTREQDPRDRIANERRERTELIAEEECQRQAWLAPSTNHHPSDAPAIREFAIDFSEPVASVSERWITPPTDSPTCRDRNPSDDDLEQQCPETVCRVNLHDMSDELADLEGQTPIEHALAGGEPQRVGWFRFYFADERWEWSPQVERMHGYEPGNVNPTTDLVLSHKHPDDYGQVAATLEEIRRTSGAFSTRHRIIDTHGDIHHVVVVGDQLFDDSGGVVGTHGFYVDVTPSMNEAHEEIVSEAVAEIAEARGGIEQAKGMLMLIYRISADSAFELLKWRSQETNIKLRVLAEQISKDFLELRYDEALPARAVYDRLLLTAHFRVKS